MLIYITIVLILRQILTLTLSRDKLFVGVGE